MTQVRFLVLAALAFSQVLCDDMSNSPIDVRQYFHTLNNDMTKVTWAHRVNSKDMLEEVLKDSTIQMIEADIISGQLKGAGGGQPIPVMGHPPDTESDISLEQFLNMVLERKTGQGIKLDFKSVQIFKESENVLEQFLLKPEVDFPVWVNADILRGPGEPEGKVPVDANYFLKTCVTKFPTATISAGWTVDVEKAETLKYKTTYIDAMTTALSENNVVKPLTFPVHAGIASNSVEELSSLIHTSTDGSSLTLWAGAGDWVNYDKLRELIKLVGKDKVFVDLPAEMKDTLLNPPKQGDSSATRNVIPSVALVSLISLFFYL